MILNHGVWNYDAMATNFLPSLASIFALVASLVAPLDVGLIVGFDAIVLAENNSGI